MKTAAIRKLRAKLATDQPVFGFWVTLDSPSISEMAVGLGFDWLVVDAEHGHLDWGEITDHLRATVRSDTVALVRIAELNGSLIKRALDVGADGVIVPWIESAELLSQAVSLSRYPPEGIRGIGAERATAWGQAIGEHTAEANDHVLVVPIIETVRTAANVPAMCQVDGVDLFFFGPADFSSTAGYRGQWEGPGVAAEILRLKDIIRNAGKHCGIVAASPENLNERLQQGFRFVGLGMDTGMLIKSMRASLATAGRERSLRADLTIESEPAASVALPPLSPLSKEGMERSASRFRVGLTGDFQDAKGQPRYRDIGTNILDNAGIGFQRLADDRPEVGPEQVQGINGLVVLSSRVTAASLSRSGDLLAIGRFGVGFDSVDVPACTAADVLLFVAVGAVDRSVAEATVSWMLALSHQVRRKDRLMREGRWDERGRFMGTELRNRTLGVIGFGGIGRALVRLLSGFGMRTPLVFDPYVPAATIAALGALTVDLDELLKQADFVSIHCPLNEKTRNLIGARELALMKPTAYLLNTARGGIVDEKALHETLASGKLAGAALDCFNNEPLKTAPVFAEFDEVLLAPHCIAWTEELFRDIGSAVCQGMVDLAQGRRPRGAVNTEVFDRPGFQSKWKRLLSQ